MVSKEELKKIFLLQNLTDGMLEKIIPQLRALHLSEREILFEEGSKAENFYMLKKGKILLEVEISEQLTISLSSVKSGYSFGWSALLSAPSYTSRAVCAEPSDAFVIPGKKLRDILEGDPGMGYRVMGLAAKILKNRVERRTAQLLKVIANHPDMQKLLDPSSDDEMSTR
jgi:CRP/FNR family cyclic AMP-dependent transcriptional regulator